MSGCVRPGRRIPGARTQKAFPRMTHLPSEKKSRDLHVMDSLRFFETWKTLCFPLVHSLSFIFSASLIQSPFKHLYSLEQRSPRRIWESSMCNAAYSLWHLLQLLKKLILGSVAALAASKIFHHDRLCWASPFVCRFLSKFSTEQWGRGKRCRRWQGTWTWKVFLFATASVLIVTLCNVSSGHQFNQLRHERFSQGTPLGEKGEKRMFFQPSLLSWSNFPAWMWFRWVVVEITVQF